MQFVDTWFWLSSLLAGACVCTTAREEWAGRNNGSADTGPSCLAAAWVQGKTPAVDVPLKLPWLS